MKLFQKAVVGSIFILMRIQILDPHWKKMEWIQILTNENVQTVLFFFSLFLSSKLVNHSEFCIIYFYLTILIFVLRPTFFVLIDNSLLDPDPWIRIFLRIRIQEA